MIEYLKAICDICEGLSLAYLVLGVFTLCFFLFLGLNYFYLASARLSFVLRWLRFILLSSYIYIILNCSFESVRDFYVFGLSFCITIWGEITYMWFKASVYSKRNILPFSHFVECENAWRPSKKYYNLKRKIGLAGFEKLKSFRATNSLCLGTLFYNDREDVALLLLFRLQSNSLETLYFFVSKVQDGKYLIFTNDSSQEPLFLKGKYSIHYRRLSSFKSLFNMHKRRISYEFSNLLNFKTESVELPHLLYKDNLLWGLDAGIYSQGEELLTAEGKFQFCKKLIINNYFRI